ncbi:MAG: phage antirepressor KilAC domain-containing protein [Catonella sp.]
MNKLSVVVEKVNEVLVTTSNRVAEELGVNHRDLLEKIDGYISKFGSAETSAGFYIPNEYVHPQNKQVYRNYFITEKGIAQLIGGYSAAVPKAFDLNVAYINEFERMKNALTGGRVPTSYKDFLLLALEQEEKMEALRLENKVQEQQIAELKPKASYYDLVLQCKDLLSMTEIAKDYGMSAKGMNSKLHELGVQYKQSGIWFLYAKYQDKGYTQTKTQNYNKPDGTQGVSTHTYWSQKGRLFLYELLKDNGILPMIEREQEVA